MKKKKTLLNAAMVVGVAALGFGVSNSFVAEANDAGWICCKSDSQGCTDEWGMYHPDDYLLYNGTTCTTC